MKNHEKQLSYTNDYAVGLQDVGASYLFIGSDTILDSPIFLFQHCNRICKHVLLKFIAMLD